MNVFHLKYRPQKITDLDLVDVSSTLIKILAQKEIPQSFLFAGPKGSGKTSAARIMARAVNCLELDGVEPCGKCDNCKEILNGSSIDIIEIDAASNRGIDDMRLLKEKSYLMPSKLRKKVFIIDEVHMLTKEAFNALLKLIEEPPKHTIFILCTTDPQKIPDTILSRLVKIDFKKGKKDELLAALKKVVAGEEIKISEESLKTIIAKNDGSFRNLHRTFNEIYFQFGKKISDKDIESFFSKRSGDYSEDELESDLVNGDAKIILERMEKMAEAGGDFTNFRERLLVHFQKKLLIFYGVDEDKDGVLSKINTNDLSRLINLLINAGKQEKDVSIDQLPLELAVIEFLDKKQNNFFTKQTDELVKKNPEIKKQDDQKCGENENIEIEVAEEKEEVIVNFTKLCIEDIEKEWGNIMMTIRPVNFSVEAFLRSTRPKTIKGNNLVVEVFYPFHKERLEELKNKKIVEGALMKVFKTELGFECVLGKNKKEPLVIKNDTPVEKVSDQLVQEDKPEKDIYDVAKDIFG